jgi:phosphotransferase family enzyme
MALIEDRFEDALLVIRGEPPEALVVREGERWVLPVVHTRDHHPADVGPTRKAMREQWGIDGFVLGCLDVEAGGGVARRLLEVEPLDGARQDQRWIGAAEAPTGPMHRLVESQLAPRARPRAVVDGRGWTRPGWWARATAWLARQAATGGWTLRSVEQIRAWEFSCVLRVETDQGDLYFKALPRAYAAEVALIQQLAAWHPAHLPAVVAADPRRRWILLRACRGPCLEAGAPLADWRRVARAYAELQVASAARIDRLRALGCRDRPPSALRTALSALLANKAALLVDQEHGLTSAELQRLRAWQPRLEAACDELTAGGLPRTLEHGDLWASNIFVGDGEPTFIDWTDACLSHPFLSLGPLLRSASWDPHLAGQSNARRRIADAYLEAWSASASPARLRRLLTLAAPLAALHIAVSYWSLTPRPHRQWWMARGVPFFARMALESLPAR